MPKAAKNHLRGGCCPRADLLKHAMRPTRMRELTELLTWVRDLSERAWLWAC